MKLVRITILKGKSLAEVIVNVSADLHLELNIIVGMGSDGAANMSGKDEGVQNHLKQAGAVFATYFHCFAHRLNLVLEHSVENISTVNDIFVTIGDIYRYMEGSPERHAVFESHLAAKGITNGKTVLHAYSDTRWTAQSENLEVVLNVFFPSTTFNDGGAIQYRGQCCYWFACSANNLSIPGFLHRVKGVLLNQQISI